MRRFFDFEFNISLLGILSRSALTSCYHPPLKSSNLFWTSFWSFFRRHFVSWSWVIFTFFCVTWDSLSISWINFLKFSNCGFSMEFSSYQNHLYVSGYRLVRYHPNFSMQTAWPFCYGCWLILCATLSFRVAHVSSYYSLTALHLCDAAFGKSLRYFLLFSSFFHVEAIKFFWDISSRFPILFIEPIPLHKELYTNFRYYPMLHQSGN